jgi:hypothetical protein
VRRADLLTTTVCAVGGVFVVWLVPGASVLRLLFGLALVLAVPGYAVSAALFPAGSLARSDRLAVSIALSLVTAILGGLLVHALNGVLDARTFVALLADVTILATVVALRRDRSGGARASSLPRLSRPHIAALVLSALLLAAAVALARTPLPAHNVAGYTALWLLPKTDASLDLGVRSGEHSTSRYRLDLRVGGTVARRWRIELVPGATWQIRIPAQGSTAVQATLMRGDSRRVYRRVALHAG